MNNEILLAQYDSDKKCFHYTMENCFFYIGVEDYAQIIYESCLCMCTSVDLVGILFKENTLNNGLQYSQVLNPTLTNVGI